MKIRSLSKLFKTEIHDHHVIIGIFITLIVALTINDHYINTNNCYLLESTGTCTKTAAIDRSVILKNPDMFTYIPYYLNYNGLDSYREKPEFGFENIYCIKNSNACIMHQDSFNALQFPFGTVAHIADFLIVDCNGIQKQVGSSCFGVSDYYITILVWAGVIFGGYYILKSIILYIKKHF